MTWRSWLGGTCCQLGAFKGPLFCAPGMGALRLGKLYLELLLEEDPTGAAQYGVHGRGDDPYYYDRRMPDPAPEARANFAVQRTALQKKLAAMNRKEMSRPR